MKPLCQFGKNPLNLRSYRHPKDGEGSEDADKMEEENEILDQFQTDEQKLQEAKDHEFAIQLSQEEMSDGTASVSRVFDEQKQPKKSDVVPVEGNIMKLMEMPFTREQAIKALKMTENNIEQAVDWLFGHPEFAIQLSQEEMSDDKDKYAPFCIKPSTAFEGNCTASVSRVFDGQKQSKKSDVVPVEGKIIMLMEMSFTRKQAIKALKMTDNNIEQAVDWLFGHPGDINQETPSGSQVDLHFSLASDSEDEYDKICKKPSAAF